MVCALHMLETDRAQPEEGVNHEREQPKHGERENERGHARLRLCRGVVREQREALERPSGSQPHGRTNSGAPSCRDHRVKQVCFTRASRQGGAVGRELCVCLLYTSDAADE